MADGQMYRNVGATHLRTDRSFVEHDELFVPTPKELASFPDKFILEAEPAAPEVEAVVEVTVSVEAAAEEEEAPVAEAPDVSSYHQGAGWYLIPGVGKVRGKQRALAALLTAGI